MVVAKEAIPLCCQDQQIHCILYCGIKIFLMKFHFQGQVLQTFSIYWPLCPSQEIIIRILALSNSLVNYVDYLQEWLLYNQNIFTLGIFFLMLSLICKICGEKNNVFSQDWFVLLSSINCLYTQRSAGKQMVKSWLLAMKMGMCFFKKTKTS